jgi:beta-galactosidase
VPPDQPTAIRPCIVKGHTVTRFILPLTALLTVLPGCISSSVAGTPAEESGVRTQTSTSGPVRESLLFDWQWKFALGSAASGEDDFGYGSGAAFAKAGESFGPPDPGFNDNTWRVVDIPHDWAVELDHVNVSDNNIMNHGYKPIGRQFPRTSVGWYRRTFSVPLSDEGRKLALKFDGVFRNSRAWVNGHYIGTNLSGYEEFSLDVSDYVRYGQRNVVTVRVDATEGEGWFYEGAGIYRHVWLLKYGPVHIPQYGVFVRSTVGKGFADVAVETALFNAAPVQRACELTSAIVDDQGKSISTTTTRNVILDQLREKRVDQTMRVSNARLWSLETPTLYTLLSVLSAGGKTLDSVVTTFGIRSVMFDKDKGFFLNGVHIKLKGVCCHQDHAGVGSALPDRLHYYRIERLKEMGCNAYRTSHHPPAPELLEACDRLGMLVMDENRLMGSSPELMGQFEKLILRDRNHPSVILWSIGNEEFRIQNTDIGNRIARSLGARVQQLDPTRQWTYAANNGNRFEGINSVVPVRGFNYLVISDIDRYHRDHPDQILLGSEEASTFCTRGIYANDTVHGYVSDYDRNIPGHGTLAESWWKFYDAREWLAGAFAWTGFDYRGEPAPYPWPCINSTFGIMDVCGFPKNNFYYYQAWWTDLDVLHIYPHWNWRGHEGKTVDVWCQSNCETVELFLNGKSLGTKTMERNGHLEWQVRYEPGILEARGVKNGRILTTKVQTTGEPARVVLTPDRGSIRADGEDVSVVSVTVVDAQGRDVADAGNLIRFEVSGAGRILGVGNGDPSSHEADKFLTGGYQRKLFSGKCQIIVQSLQEGGILTLHATSEGLQLAQVAIRTEPSPARPTAGPYVPEVIHHRAAGKKIDYLTPLDPRYPGQGPQGLVNGKIGAAEYQDDAWQGREQEDLVATIDLGEIVTLSKIGSRYLQDIDPWIFFPTSVVYEVSADGKTYRTVATLRNDVPADRQGTLIKTFSATFGQTTARYVRVTATNIGICPPGHRGAGGKAWLFVDEIMVD